MDKDVIFKKEASALSNKLKENTRPVEIYLNPSPKFKKFFKAVYLVMVLNIFLSIVLNFFLMPNKEKIMNKVKAKKQSVSPEPVFAFPFHDLSLPLWAKGFIMPIIGAKVPENPSLLPGAPRNYRNGVHQGMDIYCAFGTKVLAAKAGCIISAGSDYVEIPPIYRKELLHISTQLYHTPPEILNLLHGRRIILDHGIIDGRWVLTVYSHLSEIRKGLKIGDFVKQGDVIGYVGNSGTSLAGTNGGAHLHFEIRINGQYLGCGMKPTEAGRLLKAILEKE